MRKVHADFIGVNYIVLIVFEVFADTLQDISIDVDSRRFLSIPAEMVLAKRIGENNMKKILLIALVIQSFFIDCYSQSNQVFVSTDRNLKLMLKACEYSADGKYKQAVLCYKQCAIKSDPYCQCFLAYHYEKGLGVAQDYSKAAKWYQKSAEQGNSIAQCTL